MDDAREPRFEQDVQSGTPLRGAFSFASFLWASKEKKFTNTKIIISQISATRRQRRQGFA